MKFSGALFLVLDVARAFAYGWTNIIWSVPYIYNYISIIKKLALNIYALKCYGYSGENSA